MKTKLVILLSLILMLSGCNDANSSPMGYYQPQRIGIQTQYYFASQPNFNRDILFNTINYQLDNKLIVGIQIFYIDGSKIYVPMSY